MKRSLAARVRQTDDIAVQEDRMTSQMLATSNVAAGGDRGDTCIHPLLVSEVSD